MSIARSLRKSNFLKPISGAFKNYLASVDRKNREEEFQADLQSVLGDIENIKLAKQRTISRVPTGGLTPSFKDIEPTSIGLSPQEQFGQIEERIDQFNVGQITDPKSAKSMLSRILSQAKPEAVKDIDTFQFDDDLYTRTPTGVEKIKEGKEKPPKAKTPRIKSVTRKGNIKTTTYSDDYVKTEELPPKDKKETSAEKDLRVAKNKLSALEAVRPTTRTVVVEEGGIFSNEVTEEETVYGSQEWTEDEYQTRLQEAQNDVEIKTPKGKEQAEPTKTKSEYHSNADIIEFKRAKDLGMDVESVIKEVEIADPKHAFSNDQANDLREMWDDL